MVQDPFAVDAEVTATPVAGHMDVNGPLKHLSLPTSLKGLRRICERRTSFFAACGAALVVTTKRSSTRC